MADAYLNGIKLDCETIEDSFSKAIAKYEIPYRDEALLEDMGLNARKVMVKCYFFNDTYSKHEDLLKLLYGENSFELQHPEYGLLAGSIESVTVGHDDRAKTAEVSFTFVEGVTEIAAIVMVDVKATSEELYTKALTEAGGSLEEKIKIALGADAVSVIEQVLDPALDIYEQITGISIVARDYVKKVDTAVRTFEGTLVEIVTPVNRLISTIDFATNLPGRVLSSIANMAHKYSQLYETSIEAPDRFMQSFQIGLAELESSVFSNHSVSTYIPDDLDADTHVWHAFKSVIAAEAALQAGSFFSTDEENRSQNKQQEGVKSFDVLGNYIQTKTLEQVMNVREIEATLDTTRNLVQVAIACDRQNNEIKQLSLLLLNHVKTIKLELEKIVTVGLDNELPLHLVCLKYDLPYKAAERLMAINNIPTPNFTGGEIDIYER